MIIVWISATLILVSLNLIYSIIKVTEDFSGADTRTGILGALGIVGLLSATAIGALTLYAFIGF